MALQTWTRKDWAEFDNVDEGALEPNAPNPVEVDDPEGDPMMLSDVDEEGLDYDPSAASDERHQEEWRMKR